MDNPSGRFPAVLIVDDEKHTREGLAQALEESYEVLLARDAEEAFRLMDEQPFDVVLTDLRMAGKSGLKVIDHALSKSPQPVCIMMTAYGTVEAAVEAMKRGATDFLTKPVNLEKLEILMRRALQSRRLEKENRQLQQRLDQKYSFQGIIGHSRALTQALEQVRQVAPARVTVLLQGETGTGKELFAQMIHQNSPRAQQAFMAVHCAALPASLLESEIFGHEKGAFTGAVEKRIGRFEAAHGGTLFLDEIGEIDASTQVKLLRFLETRTFERLGSTKPMTVDVRLVCATNRDLLEMVKKGEFREDLYYRLNVVSLKLPPLRERVEDIPVLLDHYVKHFSAENGVTPIRFSSEAMKVLQAWRWPGNIRELRNFCENCVVLRHGTEVTEQDLDAKFFGRGEEVPVPSLGANAGASGEKEPPVGLSIEENEKRLLRQALREASGNRTRAAELMGISRRTLHRKLLQWPELDVSV